MNRPRIKICGITREIDARRIAELGADYIGLIFHRQSPRFVTIKQAQKIRESVGPVIQTVAVFVEERPERIISICHKLQTSIVQLHGSQDNRFIKNLQREGLKVARAFHVRNRAGWKRVRETAGDFALLDNQTPAKAGGTGESFDWSVAPLKALENVILSGGLNVRNFAEGARVFSPVILDFNSGVEDSPGKKSEQKLRQLIRSYHKLYNTGG